ncbi:DUF1761 domain-containing protein [bacterium]|nr:DUF1761 domain-containing protein [bacterium]
MDMSQINYLAVVVAALSSFVIGGIWYSPILFAKSWMIENGFTEESLKGGNQGMIFGGSFILALIMSFNLAAFLQGPPDLAWGITAGALAGIGWVACSLGVTYLFERKSMKLFLINAGYHAITFMIMGGIIGIWK